ncbi:uL15 family ribosomal protein [Candidatus Uhrbacteria bacterium]|nr:uL15 family ribosomal protein [Candidatus Uhrbacteria bacterium]
MHTLHTLQHAPGARTKRVRVGRGTGSGIGTYSGRGIKGQKARSGGRKGLKARGMRALILRIPKMRGFHREQAATLELSSGKINAMLQDGQTLSPQVLKSQGLWKQWHQRAKILGGKDTWQRKNITVIGIGVSRSIAKTIRELGGTIKK